MRVTLLMLSFMFALMFAGPAAAQNAESETNVPNQLEAQIESQIEIRAQSVGRALRCVVCQNQSIEDSEAELAQDMRRLVRARLQAGDSDKQVLEFMQQRYGDFVLLKPPVQSNTLVLWFAPFLAVLLGGLWFALLRRRSVTAQPLSQAERDALDAIFRADAS